MLACCRMWTRYQLLAQRKFEEKFQQWRKATNRKTNSLVINPLFDSLLHNTGQYFTRYLQFSSPCGGAQKDMSDSQDTSRHHALIYRIKCMYHSFVLRYLVFFCPFDLFTKIFMEKPLWVGHVMIICQYLISKLMGQLLWSFITVSEFSLVKSQACSTIRRRGEGGVEIWSHISDPSSNILYAISNIIEQLFLEPKWVTHGPRGPEE